MLPDVVEMDDRVAFPSTPPPVEVLFPLDPVTSAAPVSAT